MRHFFILLACLIITPSIFAAAATSSSASCASNTVSKASASAPVSSYAERLAQELKAHPEVEDFSALSVEEVDLKIIGKLRKKESVKEIVFVYKDTIHNPITFWACNRLVSYINMISLETKTDSVNAVPAVGAVIGSSSLMHAVRQNSPVAKELLFYGADPHQQSYYSTEHDKQGSSIVAAIELGANNCMEFILSSPLCKLTSKGLETLKNKGQALVGASNPADVENCKRRIGVLNSISRNLLALEKTESEKKSDGSASQQSNSQPGAPAAKPAASYEKRLEEAVKQSDGQTNIVKLIDQTPKGITSAWRSFVLDRLKENSPLELYCVNGELHNCLTFTARYCTPEQLQTFLKLPAIAHRIPELINCVPCLGDVKGASALQHCIYGDHARNFQLLLDHGADPCVESLILGGYHPEKYGSIFEALAPNGAAQSLQKLLESKKRPISMKEISEVRDSIQCCQKFPLTDLARVPLDAMLSMVQTKQKQLGGHANPDGSDEPKLMPKAQKELLDVELKKSPVKICVWSVEPEPTIKQIMHLWKEGIVKLLVGKLTFERSVFVVNGQLHNPLTFAARYLPRDHFDAFLADFSPEETAKIIDMVPTLGSYQGSNALMQAVSQDNHSNVRALLERGADPFAPSLIIDAQDRGTGSAILGGIFCGASQSLDELLSDKKFPGAKPLIENLVRFAGQLKHDELPALREMLKTLQAKGVSHANAYGTLSAQELRELMPLETNNSMFPHLKKPQEVFAQESKGEDSACSDLELSSGGRDHAKKRTDAVRIAETSRQERLKAELKKNPEIKVFRISKKQHKKNRAHLVQLSGEILRASPPITNFSRDVFVVEGQVHNVLTFAARYLSPPEVDAIFAGIAAQDRDKDAEIVNAIPTLGDVKGSSALLHALMNQKQSMVATLIRYGANPLERCFLMEPQELDVSAFEAVIARGSDACFQEMLQCEMVSESGSWDPALIFKALRDRVEAALAAPTSNNSSSLKKMLKLIGEKEKSFEADAQKEKEKEALGKPQASSPNAVGAAAAAASSAPSSAPMQVSPYFIELAEQMIEHAEIPQFVLFDQSVWSKMKMMEHIWSWVDKQRKTRDIEKIIFVYDQRIHNPLTYLARHTSESRFEDELLRLGSPEKIRQIINEVPTIGALQGAAPLMHTLEQDKSLTARTLLKYGASIKTSGCISEQLNKYGSPLTGAIMMSVADGCVHEMLQSPSCELTVRQLEKLLALGMRTDQADVVSAKRLDRIRQSMTEKLKSLKELDKPKESVLEPKEKKEEHHEMNPILAAEIKKNPNVRVFGNERRDEVMAWLSALPEKSIKDVVFVYEGELYNACTFAADSAGHSNDFDLEPILKGLVAASPDRINVLPTLGNYQGSSALMHTVAGHKNQLVINLLLNNAADPLRLSPVPRDGHYDSPIMQAFYADQEPITELLLASRQCKNDPNLLSNLRALQEKRNSSQEHKGAAAADMLSSSSPRRFVVAPRSGDNSIESALERLTKMGWMIADIEVRPQKETETIVRQLKAKTSANFPYFAFKEANKARVWVLEQLKTKNIEDIFFAFDGELCNPFSFFACHYFPDDMHFAPVKKVLQKSKLEPLALAHLAPRLDDLEGPTPLMNAAMFDCKMMLRHLLALGVDPWTQSRYPKSFDHTFPANVAMLDGAPETFQELLNSAWCNDAAHLNRLESEAKKCKHALAKRELHLFPQKMKMIEDKRKSLQKGHVAEIAAAVQDFETACAELQQCVHSATALTKGAQAGSNPVPSTALTYQIDELCKQHPELRVFKREDRDATLKWVFEELKKKYVEDILFIFDGDLYNLLSFLSSAKFGGVGEGIDVVMSKIVRNSKKTPSELINLAPRIDNFFGPTPIMVATCGNNLAMLDYFLQEGDPLVESRVLQQMVTRLPAHIAFSQGSLECFERMLNHPRCSTHLVCKKLLDYHDRFDEAHGPHVKSLPEKLVALQKKLASVEHQMKTMHPLALPAAEQLWQQMPKMSGGAMPASSSSSSSSATSETCQALGGGRGEMSSLANAIVTSDKTAFDALLAARADVNEKISAPEGLPINPLALTLRPGTTISKEWRMYVIKKLFEHGARLEVGSPLGAYIMYSALVLDNAAIMQLIIEQAKQKGVIRPLLAMNIRIPRTDVYAQATAKTDFSPLGYAAVISCPEVLGILAQAAETDTFDEAIKLAMISKRRDHIPQKLKLLVEAKGDINTDEGALLRSLLLAPQKDSSLIKSLLELKADPDYAQDDLELLKMGDRKSKVIAIMVEKHLDHRLRAVAGNKKKKKKKEVMVAAVPAAVARSERIIYSSGEKKEQVKLSKEKVADNFRAVAHCTVEQNNIHHQQIQQSIAAGKKAAEQERLRLERERVEKQQAELVQKERILEQQANAHAQEVREREDGKREAIAAVRPNYTQLQDFMYAVKDHEAEETSSEKHIMAHEFVSSQQELVQCYNTECERLGNEYLDNAIARQVIRKWKEKVVHAKNGRAQEQHLAQIRKEKNAQLREWQKSQAALKKQWKQFVEEKKSTTPFIRELLPLIEEAKEQKNASLTAQEASTFLHNCLFNGKIDPEVGKIMQPINGLLSEYLAVEPEKRDEIREKVRRILQKRIIVDNADIKERDKRGRAVYDLLMEVLPDLAHESQRLTQNQLSKLRARLIDAAQTNDERIFQEIQQVLARDYKNFAVPLIEQGSVTHNSHHLSLVDIKKSLCLPDEQGCAALPTATMNGYHTFALRLHEEYGAESDALDVTGVTPFSYAAASCQLLQAQVNEERNLNMLLLKAFEGDELTAQEQQLLTEFRQRKALQRVASRKLSSKAPIFEPVQPVVSGPVLAHASAPMHHVQHVSAERKDNRRIGSERAVATAPSVLRSGQTTAHELAQPRMPHSQPRIKYIPRGQLGHTNRSPNVPLLTRQHH